MLVNICENILTSKTDFRRLQLTDAEKPPPEALGGSFFPLSIEFSDQILVGISYCVCSKIRLENA